MIAQRRRRLGRREMVQLAALGLGGLAVACRGGGNAGGKEPSRSSGASEDRGATTEPSQPAAGDRTEPAAPNGAKLEAVCLVTKQQGLSAGYAPPDLAPLPVRISAGDAVRLRQPAIEAAVSLIDAAAGDGQVLFGLSG